MACSIRCAIIKWYVSNENVHAQQVVQLYQIKQFLCLIIIICNLLETWNDASGFIGLWHGAMCH